MEMTRYARTLAVQGFTEEHQRMLGTARVLVVGCGALGSQVALYLAGSGVGRIGLVDFDNVDLSNLQRQVAYRMKDLGHAKVDVLAHAVTELNPDVVAAVLPMYVHSAAQLASVVRGGGYQVVVEATDTAASKKTVMAGAREAGVTCVVGGVDGWTGQVTVISGHPDAPDYDDIFGEITANDQCSTIAPCTLRGVMGPVPGIIASVQAVEVIKTICRLGRTLEARLLVADALSMQVQVFSL